MTAWIVLLLIGFVVPATGLFILLPRAGAALRSGGFSAYGFPVTRAKNPLRFWLAIVSWLFLAAFSVFLGVFAVADFLKG
jgi:hypothetical protein